MIFTSVPWFFSENLNYFEEINDHCICHKNSPVELLSMLGRAFQLTHGLPLIFTTFCHLNLKLISLGRETVLQIKRHFV